MGHTLAFEDSDQSEARRQPVVWSVVGDKVGDNAQLDAIVEALGWTCERKRLHVHERYRTRRPLFRASLHHIDPGRSDALEPPWPDLILTIGRRPSMASLWVRKQSGNRTKVVIVGRAHRMIDQFDLVVTSALFHLPDHPNVLKLDLPVMRYSAARIAAAAEEWRERLSALERPLTAVLVGGPEDPFSFDEQTARQLMRQAANLPGGSGSLVVMTSRRTPRTIVEALTEALPPNGRLYPWTSEGHANPYAALLGLADRFVVTGDSISMMIEVIRSGKPLAIAPLPRRAAPWSRLEQALGRRFRSAEANGSHFWQRLKAFLHHQGIAPFARDTPGFHAMLFERGLAVPLGQPFPAQPAAASDDLNLVVSRIRMLCGQGVPVDQEPPAYEASMPGQRQTLVS